MTLGTGVVFLSPLGLLLTLGVVLPLCALYAITRRGDRLRRFLGIGPLRRVALLVPVLAAVVAASLVGLAAAQPVVEQTVDRRVRTDAEAYVVFDVTRSMLARRSAGSASRLARAKREANVLRAALANVPIGIASYTDRVLPHLFPSVDDAVFRATVERAVGIEKPPPRSSFMTNATSLDSLAAVPVERFFALTAKKRVLVVFTDGESQAVNVGRLARVFSRPPGLRVVFVQLWSADDHVYTRGVPEAQYRPDPSARANLEELARATDSSVYGEQELGAAIAKARSYLGSGPTVVRGTRTSRHALAPYLAFAAFFPLAVLLWRRDR
jgi:hypothetical protein